MVSTVRVSPLHPLVLFLGQEGGQEGEDVVEGTAGVWSSRQAAPVPATWEDDSEPMGYRRVSTQQGTLDHIEFHETQFII